MSEIQRLYRIHSNVVQMCKDRNYTVPSFFLFANEKEFILPKDMICTNETSMQSCYIVYEQGDTPIGVQNIKDMVDKMNQHECHNGILICKNPITAFAKRVIQELVSSTDTSIRKNIECFEQSELYYNITQHSLVPQHIVLTTQEKTDVLRRYKLKKDSQLPRIMHTDPIARYYGLHKGQVIKIVRFDKTLDQRFVSYRVVV